MLIGQLKSRQLLAVGFFLWFIPEFSGSDKNSVQARRASECIVEYQEMHLLAPRACILGVFTN